MAELGNGLVAMAHAVATCARCICFVYITGLGCKTFLIYTGKAQMNEFKDWFKFREQKKTSRL